MGVIGQNAPGQPRKVLETTLGPLEERLEQQVLQHVVAAEVEDIRDLRAQQCDVGEVLIRTHADVGTTARTGAQRRCNEKEGAPDGDELDRVEVTAFLRKAEDARTVRRIALRPWPRDGVLPLERLQRLRRRNQQRATEQRGKNRDHCKWS